MAAEPAPISVRVIRGLRRGLERHYRRLLLGLLLVGGLASLLGGIYTVENGETAARLRFGALVDTQGPGLSFRWPLGMERIERARTGEVLRLEITGDNGEILSLLSGDENLIDAELVVQYRIRELGDFLFATEDVPALVSQAVRTALVESFAATPVDDLLTSARASLAVQIRTETQRRLDAYGCGISLVAVNLQSLNPPREAAAAFRGVSDARAEAAKAVNRAEGARDGALRLARGEAQQLLTGALSEADTRTRGAQGAADRFRALLAQDRANPGPTRIELYHATLRKVLPEVRLLVLAPGQSQIDLQLLPPGTGSDDSQPAIPPGLSMDDR